MLSKNHARQMEGLITSTTNAIKEMMLLLKENKNPNPTNNQTSEEKKKKRDEKCQKYNNAPICKNCGRKHPSKAEDKCWEQKKQGILTNQLEIKQKHLKVQGVRDIRDVAAKSDSE